MYPDEVMDDLFSFKGELFIGGPVSSNTLHFLHTLGEEIPGAVQITQNVFWGGDFETIKEMVNKNLIDREKVKFFAGYSGWSPGQLEEEIDEKSWIVSSINENLIMSPSITNIWKETISNLGDIYKTWSNFPQNPTFN